MLRYTTDMPEGAVGNALDDVLAEKRSAFVRRSIQLAQESGAGDIALGEQQRVFTSVFEQQALLVYPQPYISIAATDTWCGYEYGWVGDRLFARRTIDADLAPAEVHHLAVNAGFLKMLVGLHDTLDAADDTPENRLWQISE